MACAHKLLETPFCPCCGEAVANDPLAGLLSHVNKHVYLNKQSLSSAQRLMEIGPGDHLDEEKATQWEVEMERRVAGEIRLLNKWAGWQSRLMEILNAETQN